MGALILSTLYQSFLRFSVCFRFLRANDVGPEKSAEINNIESTIESYLLQRALNTVSNKKIFLQCDQDLSG